MSMKSLRGGAAVIAGLGVIVVLSTVTDTVLEATGVFPPVEMQRREGFTTGWMLALAIAYRTAYLVVGGYVTASLAPRAPVRHAVVLGAVGAALTLAGAIAVQDVTPVWFSVLLIAEALPCVWLGARLRSRVTADPASLQHPSSVS